MKCNCGALVEWYWQGRPKVLGERPASVPLFSPQVARNIPWSNPGLRCVRLMSNRWSHRRSCSTCVFNFEVDKPTNYHLLTLFHSINKMCLIRQFMCCKGVPENIRQVKIFFIFFYIWLETVLKIMGLAKGFVNTCKTTNPKYVIHQLFFAKRDIFRNALCPHLIKVYVRARYQYD